MRRIVSGPDQLREVGDYRAWLFELEDEDRQKERVEFRLTGSAGATAKSSLPSAVAEARRTNGLSIVQRLLSWDRIPPIVEACTDWIALRHANGYFSRVYSRSPRNPEVLIEADKIRIPYGQGVEEIYEFASVRWIKRSLHRGRQRQEEPRMLSDVLGKLSDEQRQHALDIDPQGAASLPPLPLNENEQRIFGSLLYEPEQASVEKIRIELTHGQPLAWEEVVEALDALRIRGYVREAAADCWQITPQGHAVKRRLLGGAQAAAA